MFLRISPFCFLLLCIVHFLFIPPKTVVSDVQYSRALEKLIKEIEIDVQATSSYLNKSKLDPQVIEALRRVPRHEFVPAKYQNAAYINRPLPIGYGQTISQPYIVAIMTDLIAVEASDRVLEIGSGSGYQAAILSEIVDEVYSIEIIKPLMTSVQERINRLGYNNIYLRFGDGYYGWEEHAPFDAIIVTAASSHIPPPLIKQLKPGGKMIIPVGGPFMLQHLVLVEKHEDGSTNTRQLLPVQFVPLTGIRE